MKIQRFHPSPVLAPLIREFIILESELGTDSRILPDTSMVMAFRYKGRVEKFGEEDKETISAAAITGLRRSHRLLYYSENTANFLVVLKEGGIAAFSRLPAHELFDLTIPIENLFSTSAIDEILQRLAEAATNYDRVDEMETFLLQHLTRNKPDSLVGEAVRMIRQQNGLLKIKHLAASLHISQDPFEKRFRAQIGSTPKHYASIIRLRNMIDTYPSYSSLTEATYEAGYFDQSHFIKDFRLFTGQSPKDFFRSARFW